MSDSHRTWLAWKREVSTSSLYENLQDNDHNFCMSYAVNVLSLGTLSALIEIYNYLNSLLLPETGLRLCHLPITYLFIQLPLAFCRLTYIACGYALLIWKL